MPTRKAAAAARLESPPEDAATAALAPALKLLFSGLVVFHQTAVFWAPFAFACNVGGSSSPLADAVERALRPYIGAMFLDHGYFFFAPNPGPNHLVRYKVEFDDGHEPLVGTFPDME